MGSGIGPVETSSDQSEAIGLIEMLAKTMRERTCSEAWRT